MSVETSVVLSVLSALGVTLVTAYVLSRCWPTVSSERLRPARPQTDDDSVLRFEDRGRPQVAQIAERIGRSFGTRDVTRLAAYRSRLVIAGFLDPRAVPAFLGAKLGLAVAAPALYILWSFFVAQRLPQLLPAGLGAAAGFFAPNLWLSSRIKARRRDVVNALPEVLDLLMVCVEAGMGFDSAVARVAEQPRRRRSPLHELLMLMHLETRAGRGRDEALRAFAERAGVSEVKSVVSAFVQSDRLGTPLGKTLRVHAESARVGRRQRAEERAQLAPVKMLFPTVFFLMPSFFLVSMGPTLLLMLKLFSSMGGAVR
jgi:tight adherence protein C